MRLRKVTALRGNGSNRDGIGGSIARLAVALAFMRLFHIIRTKEIWRFALKHDWFRRTA